MKKNRRHHEQPKPQREERNAFVSTFGDRVGTEMRTTNDLMNWLIFGDTKQRYYPSHNDHGGF